MSVASGEPAGYALAFDQGQRAIAEQAATMKEARDRVGAVVSAAAIAAGLSSGLAFDSARIDRLTAWGALAATLAAIGFGVIVLSAVVIWWPTRLTLTLHPGVIVGSYVEADPPASLAEMHRDLALHVGNHVQFNRDQISDRLMWFSAALVGFVAEIGGLMLVLVDVAR